MIRRVTLMKTRVPLILILAAIVAVAAVCGLSAVSARCAESDLASALHGEALRLYREGAYEEAIELWERELAVNPGSAMALNDIGIAYRELKKPAAALDYHRKALALDPQFGHGHYSAGLALYDLGYYDAAADSFRKAIDLNHKRAVSYFNLGLALEKLGDHGASEAALQKALAEGYDSTKCRFHLAAVYRGQGDHEKAIQNLEQVVSVEPPYQGAYYYLGVSYEAMGKYLKARKAFRKEQALHTDWQCAAKDADDQLEAHLWFWSFLKAMGVIIVRLLWVAGAFALPAYFLKLMRGRKAFLRPSYDKVILFFAVLLLAPCPWILPAVRMFVPAIPGFVMLSELAVRAADWYKLWGILIMLAYFIAVIVGWYCAVCAVSRLFRRPLVLLGLSIALLIVSFFHIYPVYIAGKGGRANALKVYQGLAGHVYLVATDQAPELTIDE